ncbi:hypothetical protein [Ochrobactrum soli]|nr:hypothetical protein [[Ochrobactrum] soli]
MGGAMKDVLVKVWFSFIASVGFITFPAIGAGIALAGVWIGFISFNAALSKYSYFELISMNIWTLIKITIGTVIIADIFFFFTFLYASIFYREKTENNSAR